jgi:transcriptional regulator with XRE-family HTH domain
MSDARREGGTMQRPSIYHDEVRDFDFADRALALRQRAGLTQRELAAYLGVNYKAIGTWEGGHCYPSAERLKQLIALYRERGVLAAGREEEEAAALWGAVRGAAARRTVPFDHHWFTSLHGPAGITASAAPPPLAIVPLASTPPDDMPVMQGRTEELSMLARWTREERCRLVLVLGEGGIGKTTLAARLAHDLASEFAAMHWCSLRHAPLPDEWLAGAIAALSAPQIDLPDGLEARLGLLLGLLRERRCLLVLDNLETVLEPGVPGVRYRAGYEGYGEIFRRLGESAHQGCLLVTSREQPLREDQTAVRALHLHGLELGEVRALLGYRDLAGDDAVWQALVARYAGNPLALQVVGKTIGAVLDGDIAAFLAHDVAVFGEIRQLIDEQVARLSRQERVVLSWLAQEREPVRFAELVSDLGPLLGRVAVVEAVEALLRRSLLESAGRGILTLQPVVLEYVIAQQAEHGAAGQATAVGAHQGRVTAQPAASGRSAVTGAWRRGRAQQAYGPGGMVTLSQVRGNLRGSTPP